ncbi:TPA: hypothetical protein NR472_002797 [Listeria innocua]|uniref:hypothetical protein n=1 Tax=Listeria innocua TaxID=1642 RepID=UPI000F28E70A|nr:hypothetical protein [Listeria innocua]EAA0124051.1 hypothetical protein [Listeria monocytogenes]EAC4191080.1 hypothetical protein [Listeria monocytogenes]EAC4194151.1 hypothetical protein [Listeria monocytogenes]EAC6117655.1 hypothetical protein [Listeria monocytogenes]EAC6129417.1 hypothetical protein [Listeria monocytogenes]
MKTYYVKVAENGYIEGWGDRPEENTVEVFADENLVNKLFCVKIVNKKAVLDQEQFEKLQGNQLPEKTEIEKIREELLLTQEALAALFESNLG